MLIIVLLALFLIFHVAKYIDNEFVSEETRKATKQYVQGWYDKASTSNVVKLLHNNFLLLSHILDKVYGKGIITKRVLNSTVYLTYLYIIFVSLCGLVNPDYKLAMNPSPSQVMEGGAFSVPTILKGYQNFKSNTKAAQLKPEQEKLYLALLSTLQTDNTVFGRAIFTFLCISGFWIMATLFNFVSVTSSRFLLRELATTEGIAIMVTSLLFNIFALTLLYAFGIVIICSILFPPLGILIVTSLYFSVKLSAYLGLWLACTYAFTACALSPIWMKALVLFSLLPLVAIVACIFFTIVTKPYKDKLYGGINKACVWIIEHKHGPLGFLFATLAMVFGAICEIATALKW